jgi:cytochrome c oxidase subunit 2
LLRKAFILPFAAALLGLILAGCSATPGPGMARGREMFQTCAPCHGGDGAGNRALAAPAIAGLPKWYLVTELTKFEKGIRGADPRDQEGARMRPMARTLYKAGDLESVAEYVASLPPHPPGVDLAAADTAAGSVTFNGICTTCHGPKGLGNEAMGAPPLVHQHDWYMKTQLEKFKTGVRGAHPEDATGAQMAAMSQTLADSTAMLNVIAYIRSLQK